MPRVSAVPSTVGEVLEPRNPATLELVGSMPVTEPGGVAEIVAEARFAQRQWAARSLGERRRLLRDVAGVLLGHVEEITDTIVVETGKPKLEAVTTELFVALDTAAWLSRNVGRVLGDERLAFRQPYALHKHAVLRYEPLGVVGVVAPWNFPFSIPFSQAATAVAAGNAVIVKPSELTPFSGEWVERVFAAAGAPAGLVRVVQGAGPETGDVLVRSPGVDGLVFTGSAAAGRLVAEHAAARLCPVTLELGGKDPMLVLADADIARAVEGALWGSFSNCGQICSGIERIYVEADLYEPFLEGLTRRTRELRVGRGDQPGNELGPLISERQREKVEELVADAVEHGAEIVTGGGRPDIGLPGWFHEPTVLAGEPVGARLRSEEAFGPVVTVVKIENVADGIARANDSPFGLGASVWTRDAAMARAVADELEAGSVWTNDVAYSYGTCQAPWGGRKGSGYGRTHGKHGLYGLSHVKFLDADSGRFTPPWWFPYGETVADGFTGVLEAAFARGLGAKASGLWRHRHGLVELGRRSIGRR
jgi:succinate-semialdehyde dehydrogenase/glutarate-semialdehyde dehydrogenase